MKNKTISLPDELVLKLQSEQNASGLIADLLFQHFRVKEGMESKINELNKELNQVEQEAILKKQRILEEIKRAEEQRIAVEVKEREIEQVETKRQAKLEERKKNLRLNFIELTGRDMTEEELNEFLSLERGNIFDFSNEKMQKTKEEEEDLVQRILKQNIEQKEQNERQEYS